MHALINNGKRLSSLDSTASFLNSNTSSGVEESRKRIRLMTEESIASTSSQSVDVTEINMDDNETTSGSIASDVYNSYNVPEGMFYHQHNGKHWVHKMYWKMKTTLKSGNITKENICITCCLRLDGKPRDAHAWKSFVKSSALDNMKNHIKKMHPELIPDEPSIKREVEKKKATYKGSASMSMVKFMKPLLKKHTVDITRWLHLNGIPFNVLTSPEFQDIHENHYDN